MPLRLPTVLLHVWIYIPNIFLFNSHPIFSTLIHMASDIIVWFSGEIVWAKLVMEGFEFIHV